MKKVLLVLGALLIALSGAAVLALARIINISGDMAEIATQSERTQAFFDSAAKAEPWVKEPAQSPAKSLSTVSDGVKAAYTAPNGIVFKSYTSAWTEDKLEELYHELMKNTVGDEIKDLREVTVHAGTEREMVAGMQEEQIWRYSLPIVHSTLPGGLTLDFSSVSTSIRLYNGDTKRDAQAMARTLAHEYGHHFTNYHFFNSQGSLLESEYAALRGADGRFKGEITDADDYMEEHMWYIQEIAAEDYVQLMGSPTVTQIYDFYDVEGRLKQSMEEGKAVDNFDTVNVATNATPQENMTLPLAGEVPGLNEYFHSFTAKSAQNKTLALDFDISISKRVKEYGLSTGETKSYLSYELTWEKPIENAVYTLVCYDGEGRFISPVKTVRQGQQARARIGNVAVTKGNYVYNMDDALASGDKIFRVIVIDEEGALGVSKPLEKTF